MGRFERFRSYTPENVGRKIFVPTITSHFFSYSTDIDGLLISLEHLDDGRIIMEIIKDGEIKQVITNFDMELKDSEEDIKQNYYYLVPRKENKE